LVPLNETERDGVAVTLFGSYSRDARFRSRPS
jgi:hypothetical protein